MELLEKYFENEKREKVKKYGILNEYVKKGQILFTGSSLMEHFPINEFIQDFNITKTIYNRGVGGCTSLEMLYNMDTMVFDLEPSKIFINIGTNDLNGVDYKVQELIERYEEILAQIRERLPEAKLYIMAFYPVNGEEDFGNEYMKQLLKIRTNQRINEANIELENISGKYNAEFINLNKNLSDEKGNLKKEYSVEGMHIYPNGYKVIFDELVKWL